MKKSNGFAKLLALCCALFSLSIGSDSRLVFAGNLQNNTIFDVELAYTRKEALSPDGSLYAAAGLKTIEIYNTETKNLVTTLNILRQKTLDMLIEEAPPAPTANEPVFDILPLGEQPENDNIIGSMAFSPDGRYLALGSCMQKPDTAFGMNCILGTVDIWDIQLSRLYTSIPANAYGVNAIAFSPDGKYLASGGCGVLKAVGDKISTLEVIGNALNAATNPYYITPLNDLTTFPYATPTMTCGSSVIKVWDFETLQSVATLKEHKGSVQTLAFSPDGTLLASTGTDNQLKLWDIKSGAPVKSVKVRKESLNTLAFSPKGDILATGGKDKTIKIWDARGLKLLWTSPYKGAVTAIAFSPDGYLLASVGEDRVLNVWNLATRKKSPITPVNTTSAIAFSRDSRFVITAGMYRTFERWKFQD